MRAIERFRRFGCGLFVHRYHRCMPLVRIEVLKGRSSADKERLLQAVHSALVEAFEVPEDDRTQRLVEHEPEDFEIPSARSQAFTLVEITAFVGRSLWAKRALYATIVRNLGEVGVPPDDVLIVIHEPPLENWGIRGGKSADEVDLGYRLDI